MSFIGNDSRELHIDDMRRIGVGKRFWGVTLDQIPDSGKYKEELKRYLENLSSNIKGGVGLLFYGDYRQGKTSAATILAKAVVAHGGTAFFIRSDDLVGSMIEKKPFDADQTVMERIEAVDLLIIDDVGSEHVGKSQFNSSLLERLVRHRYDNKKVLIITVNLQPNKLAEAYGEGTLKVMKSMMRLVRVDGTHWYEDEIKGIK